MTPLRQKMINDMKLRRFALGTQKLYVYAVAENYFIVSPPRQIHEVMAQLAEQHVTD